MLKTISMKLGIRNLDVKRAILPSLAKANGSQT